MFVYLSVQKAHHNLLLGHAQPTLQRNLFETSVHMQKKGCELSIMRCQSFCFPMCLLACPCAAGPGGVHPGQATTVSKGPRQEAQPAGPAPM